MEQITLKYAPMELARHHFGYPDIGCLGIIFFTLKLLLFKSFRLELQKDYSAKLADEAEKQRLAAIKEVEDEAARQKFEAYRAELQAEWDAKVQAYRAVVQPLISKHLYPDWPDPSGKKEFLEAVQAAGVEIDTRYLYLAVQHGVDEITEDDTRYLMSLYFPHGKTFGDFECHTSHFEEIGWYIRIRNHKNLELFPKLPSGIELYLFQIGNAGSLGEHSLNTLNFFQASKWLVAQAN